MKKFLSKLNPEKKWLSSMLLGTCMSLSNASIAAAIDSCVTLSKTTDVAGHSCCILPPPDKLSMDMDGSSVSFSSSGSVSWLPLNGSLDSGGNINLSGTATVAGFSGVTTTFVGTQTGDTISGTFTVGSEGKLPENQPIIYTVSIDTTCGASSSCAGTYQDANMEIVLGSDLTGTVTSAGLDGKIYAVKEYDTDSNVCFVSAFVTITPDNCDIAVAGRLEVKTVDGSQQGQFDFGGGNSCSGVVAPFSLNLPKIK